MGRFLPTPAEGAQLESLFGSKHQECSDGGARARGQNLAGVGHVVHGGRDPAPGAGRRRLGHHRPRRRRNRAQDVDFDRRSPWSSGATTQDQYPRHARIQHVRPRGQDGAARGRRGDCGGRRRGRRGSRHPARVELLRRVQDAAADRGEPHGPRPRQRRARAGIADQRLWPRRDSDRAAHWQREKFDAASSTWCA